MNIPRFFSLLISLFCVITQAAPGTLMGLSQMPLYTLPGSPILLNHESVAQVFMFKEFNHFIKLGVPKVALRRALGFFFQAHGTTLMAKASQDIVPVTFGNERYLGIADYTQPSTEKRFYLLDLKTGRVEKHYVSHGLNSGKNWAQFFSNESGSRKTSLGFFITGGTYQSKAFESTAMKVYGIEATNFNAYSRNIVIHQAPYASPQFIQRLKTQFEDTHDAKYSPRLGRSFGCFAFDPDVAQQIIKKLKGGALIYSYVKDAEKQLLESPEDQQVIRVNPAFDVGEDTEEELLQRVVHGK